MKVDIRRDHRGTALVTVLVAVAFLTILGSVLLFTTYTGFQMKVAGRKSTENFYTAETAVNEVRIGVQKAASDAIAVAYTDILENYNTAVAEESEDAFRESFVNALYAWEQDGQKLFSRHALDTTTFDLDVLKGFLSVRNGVELDAKPPYAVTETADAVILRGLRVDYTDADGYATSISTDITIDKPSFSYTLSDLILSAVQDYTVIAKGELSTAALKSVQVDGNAYAGSMRIDGSGSEMVAHTDANFFICRDALTVENGGAFSAPTSSLKLWAGRIVLSGGAAPSVDLQCSTYVRDDLELSGTNASATLGGQYFGFGVSETSGVSSSSMLLSGRNATLDLSGLRRLVLAGNSFINANGTDIMMGESISIRSNQLAYLVPFNCFDPNVARSCGISSNPELIQGTTDDPKQPASFYNGIVNLNAVLWDDVVDATGTPRKLGYYIDSVQIIYQPITSEQMLIYFYMHFNSKELANEYFKEYFSHNTTRIKDYLDLYADEIKLGSITNKTAAGALIGYEDQTAYYAYASVKDSILHQMRLNGVKFENLCATLSTEVSGASATDDVYDYLIDEEKFDRARGGNDRLVFLNPAMEHGGGDSDVWAVMIDGNVDFGGESGLSAATYPNLRVLIATGNVTMNAAFTGLVVSGGNIVVNENLTRSQDEVNTALTSIQRGTEDSLVPVTLLNFLKNIGTSTTGSTSALPARDSWNLEKLVTYDNWTKNPD